MPLDTLERFKHAKVVILAETVGHARDVIADDAMDALFVDAGCESRWKHRGVRNISVKQLLDKPSCLGVHSHKPMMTVNTFEQKCFQLV